MRLTNERVRVFLARRSMQHLVLFADDFPNGTWLGDETNPEMRVRVPITPR